MEAKDLMIGDLVYDMTDCQNVKVIRIKNIIVDNDFECVNATFKNGYIDECVCCENLFPITLTKKIMLKNGFKTNNSVFKHIDIFNVICGFDEIKISLEVDETVFLDTDIKYVNFYERCEHTKREPVEYTTLVVRYVHIFQHFMRTIGFTEFAKNFRV